MAKIVEKKPKTLIFFSQNNFFTTFLVGNFMTTNQEIV